VDLVISDAHKGLRAAAEKAFHAPLQRCRVHWMRNLLAKVAVKDRKAVAAAVKPIFEQKTFEEGIKVWDLVCDGFSKTCPRAHTFMLENRDDVLLYMTYPEDHHSKISSTNILERVNKEIKRRTKVAGIFPTDNSVLRLVGSILLSMNDDWATGNRCFSVDSLAKIEEYKKNAAEKQRLREASLSEAASQQ
jgi:putative transposase